MERRGESSEIVHKPAFKKQAHVPIYMCSCQCGWKASTDSEIHADNLVRRHGRESVSGRRVPRGYRDEKTDVSLLPGRTRQPAPRSDKNKNKKKKPIILESKRGTRIDGGGCDECGSRNEKALWRCARSNQGTVYICSTCKPVVFDRSFDKSDALNTAYLGGTFESSRR